MDKKRSFYEKEIINANWSVRELKRQIESSLYERLVLSQGKQNKKHIKFWNLLYAKSNLVFGFLNCHLEHVFCGEISYHSY